VRRQDDEGLTVDGDIDDIGSSSSTGEHTGGRDTRGVVGVDVDGEIGELGTNGSDEATDGSSAEAEEEGGTGTYMVAAAGFNTPAMSLIARIWIPQSTSSWAKLR
jgi:hypothetical protein